MTISSAAAAGPNPALLALLSQLTSTQSTPNDNSAANFPQPAGGGSCQGMGGASNTLTGSGSASISSAILNMLVQLQQQAGAGTSSSSSSTTSASTSTMINPIDQLFSSMDADGDGEVSQSEMENYIEKAGGTQNQADALYTQLNQNGSNGIGEQQLASAVTPPHGGHHHHHAGGAGQTVDSLMRLLDSNGDGSVSQDEFSSFMTANGATSADASNDFKALGPNGTGSLTTASLTQAWENLQNSQSSGTLAVSLIDTFAKANAAASTTSTTA